MQVDGSAQARIASSVNAFLRPATNKASSHIAARAMISDIDMVFQALLCYLDHSSHFHSFPLSFISISLNPFLSASFVPGSVVKYLCI